MRKYLKDCNHIAGESQIIQCFRIHVTFVEEKSLGACAEVVSLQVFNLRTSIFEIIEFAGLYF